MMQLLDALRDVLEQAMSEGVDANFLTQGIIDLPDEKPETQPAPKPERSRMVPDLKYKKVKAELAEANKKI